MFAVCAIVNGKEIFSLQLVSQQGCVIRAGHTTHSWDAIALWRGHSFPSHTTLAVSTLIRSNPMSPNTISTGDG